MPSTGEPRHQVERPVIWSAIVLLGVAAALFLVGLQVVALLD